jgi:prepilin-type N-terminal cleavage/methylation domain-containing protein/prepilin-type processing-associated H-X9-DG protein
MPTLVRRQGLTLIELLLVITITGVLITLAVAGVQKVRETASRARCTNNLKNIALALHQYHDANKVLPAGVTYHRPTWYWSWLAMILPYVEKGTLHDSALDFAKSTSSDPWYPNPALGTTVASYKCPSDGRSLQTHTAYGYDVAFTSYLGVAGVPGDLSDHTPAGILYYSSSITLNQVTNGTSNTFMVGERPPDARYWFGWWFAGTGFDDSGVGDHLLGAQQSRFLTWINANNCGTHTSHCPATSTNFQQGNINNPCDLAHYWSLHPQGSNFALADGSVPFVSYSMSQSVFATMCTRDSKISCSVVPSGDGHDCHD